MPVTKIEFERAIHRGLGRAVLWLQRSEVTPDRDFLLYACTHNLAYYLQASEDRARYMFDVVHATAEPEFYSRFVMHSLEEVSDNEDNCDDDERSIKQMYNFVGLMAASGDMTAKQALYTFFGEHTSGSDYSWAEVIVNVDGLQGYLAVVHKWLEYPREEDDYWHEAHLLEDMEKRFGDDEVKQVLEEAALLEPAVGAYLAEVCKKQTAWHTRQKEVSPRDQPDYSELRRLIFSLGKRKNHMVWGRWGATLSEDDAERLAAELLVETDAQRLERYLLLFRVRPFPFDHVPLLALAQGEDQRITTAARAALARIEHPSVHDLALELMESDERPWELLELLIRNFQEGDEKAIERVLQTLEDANNLERTGLDLRDVVEENLTVVLAPALLLFYERGYCSMCRYGTIELLGELGRIPPSVVEEGRYDADDGIRELVQEIVSSNGAAQR